MQLESQVGELEQVLLVPQPQVGELEQPELLQLELLRSRQIAQ
jgi:hypothetical protein